MKQVILAKDVMTKAPYSASPNETMLVAKKRMNKYSVRHIPVVERAEPVGILSDRDIKLARAIYRHRTFNEDLTVKEVCVFNPYIVEENEKLKKVLRHMAKRRIGSAIVVKKKKLSGIITTTDICRAFAKHLDS